MTTKGFESAPTFGSVTPPSTPRKTRSDREEVNDRRTRALEEPLDVRLRRRLPFTVLEVRNPIRKTMYLVLLPEFPSGSSALCMCPDFARRGLGTCKHVEAGMRWLGDHPGAAPSDEPATPLGSAPWRAIDAQMTAAIRGSGPDSLRWRRAGAVLLRDRTAT